jgi:hypothetical protein
MNIIIIINLVVSGKGDALKALGLSLPVREELIEHHQAIAAVEHNVHSMRMLDP